MTLRALARESGISESTLYHLERGDWLPSLKNAKRLAEVLQMDPMEIDEIRAAVEKAAQGKENPARIGA